MRTISLPTVSNGIPYLQDILPLGYPTAQTYTLGRPPTMDRITEACDNNNNSQRLTE